MKKEFFTFVSSTLAIGVALPVVAQEARTKGAQPDPAAIQRGKETYSQKCGFCHGVNARGGSEAPDLVRSLVVLGDERGVELGAFLKVGVPDKGMPAFSSLQTADFSDLAAFLHERVSEARKRTSGDAAKVLIGDAAKGRAYFNGDGRCNTCHSESGDMKGVGAKYDPITLQDHIVDPRLRPRGDARPLKPTTVEISMATGATMTGSLIAITDFSVTFLDHDGNRRTITRNEDVPKVTLRDPAQAHLDMLPKYTDEALHDLTAYLVTLK